MEIYAKYKGKWCSQHPLKEQLKCEAKGRQSCKARVYCVCCRAGEDSRELEPHTAHPQEEDHSLTDRQPLRWQKLLHQLVIVGFIL